MRLEQRLIGSVAVVAVSGEITLKRANDDTLQEKVRSLVQQGHRHVLLDLAGVSFVDSAGLGELVQTSSMMRNQGGALKLVNATPRFRELLVLTRLTSLLGVYDDEAQAVASFGRTDA